MRMLSLQSSMWLVDVLAVTGRRIDRHIRGRRIPELPVTTSSGAGRDEVARPYLTPSALTPTFA